MNTWQQDSVLQATDRGRGVFNDLRTIISSGMVLSVTRRDFIDLDIYLQSVGCSWELYTFEGRELVIR